MLVIKCFQYLELCLRVILSKFKYFLKLSMTIFMVISQECEDKQNSSLYHQLLNTFKTKIFYDDAFSHWKRSCLVYDFLYFIVSLSLELILYRKQVLLQMIPVYLCGLDCTMNWDFVYQPVGYSSVCVPYVLNLRFMYYYKCISPVGMRI